MKQIRNGVFETNSSSVHSLTMCEADVYDKWCKGTGDYYFDGDDFHTSADVLKEYEENKESYTDFDEFLEENDLFKSVDEYYSKYEDEYYFETFTQTYTTKNGEKVVAFGHYGYDG